MLLDELERPDLWERTRSGIVGQFVCPQGHANPDNGLSSVLLRDRDGQLLLVPGEAVPRNEWAKEAAGLLGALPAHMITSDPVPVRAVPRSALGAVLKGRVELLEPAPDDRVPAGAEAYSGPEDVPLRMRQEFGALAMRAQELELRYETDRNTTTLDEAISAWTTAMAHPAFRAARQESRAAVLLGAGRVRFKRSVEKLSTRPNLRARGDLDVAVRYLREAMKALEGTPRAHARNNLILALERRYDRRQSPDDIDELIRLSEETLDDSLNEAARNLARETLAGHLWNRYGHDRNIADIEGAVLKLRDLQAAGPRDGRSASKPDLNLGMFLLERYDALQEPADLDDALRLIESAARDVTSPEAWNILGTARLRAGALSDLPALLDGAVEAFTKAADGAVGERHRPGYMANLGNAYSLRWSQTRNAQDLDAAIEVYEQALDLERKLDVYGWFVFGAPQPSFLPAIVATLSRAYFTRARERRSEGDNARAGELLDQVERELDECEPGTALSVGRIWGEQEYEQGNWERAARGYGRALDAVEDVFRVQVGRRHREAGLKSAGDLGARAALALVRDGRPEQAVVAVERVRARLLSDVLEKEGLDLGRLPALGHGDLVRRYLRAADAVMAP